MQQVCKDFGSLSPGLVDAAEALQGAKARDQQSLDRPANKTMDDASTSAGQRLAIPTFTSSLACLISLCISHCANRWQLLTFEAGEALATWSVMA